MLDSVNANFQCLSYHADAFAHWRNCYDSCCSMVCDPTQNYRACGKSQEGGHCNVDSDCIDTAYCSQQWHQFSLGIGGIDANGYCVSKLAPTMVPTSQPTSCPIGYFETDSSVIPCTCDQVICGRCMTGCSGSFCDGGSRNMCNCNPYGDCGDPWYSCGKTKPACSSCPDGFTTLASGATSSVQCNVPLVPSLEPTHLPSYEPVVPPTSPSPTLAPTSKTTAAMKPTKTKRKKRKKNYVYLTHSPSRKPTTKTSKGKN